MNDITFVKGQGGLTRTLPGEDHYSGLLYYALNAAVMPSGWNDGETKRIYSKSDLELKNVLATTSGFEVLHYHVREFFRLNPDGVLWVQIKKLETGDTAPDFTEIGPLINYADGKIRQAGIYCPVIFKDSFVTDIQGFVDTLTGEHKPFSVLLALFADDEAEDPFDVDLRTLESPNVSVIIGQDGDADGRELFATKGSVTCLGAALGAVSLLQVHQNIGWVGKLNMAQTELDMPALCDGRFLRDLTQNEIDSLNTLGYIFLVNHVGISGSYFNDSHTCTAGTSDYAYLENVRTIDKAIRGVRTYLLPELNAPVTVDANTGKLAAEYCKYLEETGGMALLQMSQAGELSGYNAYVDPDQNVLSTSKVEVTIQLVPKGVSRQIEVTIGFATKLG
jgi:hypothetical protein